MAGSQNVELEAAKFLHKLIQDSKDEPAKLATKLYVILQHMKSSGKENSMPYQVISRAMETVINQHGLDIEALKSSRLPSAGGTQASDSATTQFGGSSQTVGVAKDSKVGLPESEMSKMDTFASSRPPVGPSSAGHDYFQGPGSHRNSQSFDHESPSSLDSRSANSQSQERRDTANWDKQVNQRDGKKTTSKRKRGDTSVPTEPHNDNSQQLDSRNTIVNTRKGKMNKVESSSGFAIKGGEHANINILQSSSPMEQFASLSGSIRPVIRSKQECQNLIEKQLDGANINNSLSRASNLKYPEETEVSSTHNPLSQQQVPSVAHDIMGVWNQNKTGLQLEKSQVPRFPSNVVSGNAEVPLQSAAPSIGTGSFGKVHGGAPVVSSSFPTAEPGFSSPMQFGGSILTPGKVLEHDGGSATKLVDAGKLAQAGRQNSVSEMIMLRSGAPRDAGKSPVLQSSVSSGMPFKEQQLKQLRAQCLVFLAFRNGLMPKKLHLEIALGNIFPKEGGSADGPRKELVDHKGKVPSSSELNNVPDMIPFGRMNIAKETDKLPSGTLSAGRFQDIDSLSKEAGNPKVEDSSGPASDHLILPEERKHFQTSRKPDVEMQTPETPASQACLTMAPQHDSSGARSGLAFSAPGDKMENGHQQVGRANQAVSLVAVNKQRNPEIVNWTGVGNHDEVPRGFLPAPAVQHELVPERKDNAPNLSNTGSLGNHHADNSLSSFPLRDRWKPVSGIDNNHHTVLPFKDASMVPKHVSQEHLEEDNLVPTNLPPSPKYTMSEKWIMDHQKKKLQDEQKWVLKQQKTKQRIAKCFYKLKENVSSSEDISAKTKSVIELKKLQLLELQRRLRSDFLNDFFKPINTEMDRLKSSKKHKHGRRVKQLEKFEQKMKEERQKRIRERQKEFFGEIEVHKERLDDVFKFKRERWKVFNKYVKEFHKRKERIHREKIDRIQREKINLLKINDVEGYLRMVQDAKSDRVKQLLKETEKYLQKLGSKLQEAKTMATRFEHDMEEAGTSSIIEKGETAFENEDESDQAKHYLESNEKYYLMAHSIKESIAEQPSILQGGKLREYQMNGLRWLVSLYNNHLNGILADEMGLGKTVQVISLICYLMETKNDRGPFLVVVPSSVLPGWESEINFWAPSVHKIVYSGPPEERRRLFKERIVHQKFNVLLTTYEYLMNKHDRPKLSKVHWHYIIIDEGHRIKNASCKLNSDLKHYQSSHRLLLTGTPLQNNLDELWALLNFLLPNIFNSSEDFSQWFNKPFQSNGDNSPDEALLSEEENLLIINRLHQVLRPFVLRRLKHKVENQLPEKIERLIRCEASAYQKLLMKRVEDNLGSIGSSKARSVHNSVMELRNICNHPYLSQLHAEEVDNLIPKHYLPHIIRLCGKLEMLDRLLPKLKATDHRVLFFSTMTRLLDVMEEYLHYKQYRYLRLDGQTSGGDRGALIEKFNEPNSPFFIFLLSIRAGGVGVNLQAADTVIIFDTDWNPQVDLQAQARAHRIGQKREVLVLRFETVQTVEEQVRASAEHKLGVANQSITAGFFDNNTSAEDRREYLESLLRECKKEEAAPVLDDDALNDTLARSESEIDIFESVDKVRREREMATWRKLVHGQGADNSEALPPLPSRLVTEDDLKEFYEAMKIYEVPKAEVVSNVGVKRKGASLGGLDTQHYGRGKRTREVRSYEEQWTEEEFEKLCQADSPGSPSKLKEEVTETNLPTYASQAVVAVVKTELPAPPVANAPPPIVQPQPTVQPPSIVQAPHLQQSKDVTPPAKRGRGRPKRATIDQSPGAVVQTPGTAKVDTGLPRGTTSSSETNSCSNSLPGVMSGTMQHVSVGIASSQPVTTPSITPGSQSSNANSSVPAQVRGQGRRSQSGMEVPRRRGKKQVAMSPAVAGGLIGPDPKPNELTQNKPVNLLGNPATATSGTTSSVPAALLSGSTALQSTAGTDQHSGVGVAINSAQAPLQLIAPVSLSSSPSPSIPAQTKAQSRKTQSGGSGPRRRGKKQALMCPPTSGASAGEELKPTLNSQDKSDDKSKGDPVRSKQEIAAELTNVIQEQVFLSPDGVAAKDLKSTEQSVDLAQGKQIDSCSTMHDSARGSQGPALAESQSAGVCGAASVFKEALPESWSSKTETSGPSRDEGVVAPAATVLGNTLPEVFKNHTSENKTLPATSMLNSAALGVVPSSASLPCSTATEGSQSTPPCPAEPMPVKRPGRKTPSRAEAPRRRGRKQASMVSALPDGSAGQDPKLSSQFQNKSVDTLGIKSTALRSKQGTDAQEVTQAQTGEVQLTTGLPGHDPKRKDQSSYNPQIRQPTNPPATIDSATGFNDKNPVFGRIQTAAVNDVARVMKEVFSGTCLLKTKTSVSYGKEGKVVPIVPLTSKTVLEVAKNQTLEYKVNISVTTSETAAAVSDLPGKDDKQTGTGAYTKAAEENTVGDLNSSLVSLTTVGYIVVPDGSGNSTEPLSKESPKASHSDASGHILIKNDKVVDLPSVETEAVKCSGETIVAGSESSSKADDLGLGLESADTASKYKNSILHDASTERNLEAQHVDTGNKADTTSEPVNSSVTESCNMEHFSKDHIAMPLSQKVQSIGAGSAEVCTMQVDLSEGDKSNVTDVGGALSRKILVVVSDVGDTASGKTLEKMILPLSPLATEEKDHSEKSPVGSSIAFGEAKQSHAESSDQLGVSSSGDFVSASTSEALPASSMDGEENVKGSYDKGPVCSSAPSEAPKASVAEMDVLIASSTAMEVLPEKTPEPSTSLVLGEKVEHPSEKVQVCSLGPSEELKDSEADIDIQFDSSTAGQNLEEKTPEPSISFVSGEKTGHPFVEGPVCSSALAEDLKGSQAEMDIQFGSPSGGEILPEKTVEPLSSLESGKEKIECSSEKGTTCSVLTVEELKDSGAEKDVQLTSNNTGGDVLEKISESEEGTEMDVQLNSDGGVLPEKILEALSSLETTKKDGCPSESSPVCSSVPLPKDLEAEVVVQLDSCKDSGCLPEKIVPGTSSCVLTTEEKIEVSPEQHVTVEESKDSKAEKDVQSLEGIEDSDGKIFQTDSSQVDRILLENVVLDNTCQPPFSPVIEEEKIGTSSVKGPANLSAQLEGSKDNGCSPPSSSVMEEEKVEGSSEKGSANLSVQLEGSKNCGVNVESTTEACHVVGDFPENMDSEALDLPSSSLVSGEEYTEGSTGKGLVNISGTLNESKDSEAEIVDDADASPADGILPGNGPKLVDRPPSSLAREEGDIGIGGSVGLADLEGSKDKVIDQMDVSHVDRVLPQNMAETVVRSSSPLSDVRIGILTQKCLVECSVEGESKMSEAEVSDQMDASLVGGFDPENRLETVVPTSTEQEVEKNIKGSSDESPEGSSVPVDKSNGDDAAMCQEMDKPELGGSSRQDTSEKVDVPSSTQENEEIECSSEKNQDSSTVAVVDLKGSDAGSNDQMDASQARTMLPENDTPIDIDLPASSMLMEDKKFDGKEDLLDSSVVLEASQRTSAELENLVDNSQGCGVVSETASGNIDQPQQSSATGGNNDLTGPAGSIASPEKSDSEVKPGVASVVCDTVQECENIDQPQQTSEGNNETMGPAGNIVAPEKSDSDVKVGIPSRLRLRETVPECENIDQPRHSSEGDNAPMEPAGAIAPEKSDSEVKAGIASPVCDTVPECETKDLPPCSSKKMHEDVSDTPEEGPVGSLVRPEETKESKN